MEITDTSVAIFRLGTPGWECLKTLSDMDTLDTAQILKATTIWSKCSKEPLKIDVVRTPCMHTFCRGCIENAIKKKPKCPVCRSKITRRNLWESPVLSVLVADITKLHTAAASPAS